MSRVEPMDSQGPGKKKDQELAEGAPVIHRKHNNGHESESKNADLLGANPLGCTISSIQKTRGKFLEKGGTKESL